MIFTKTDTIQFYGKYLGDGLNLYHEIDDDEMGLKSEIKFIISPDDCKKLFSFVNEDDFFALCKKDGLSGMLDYLDSHEIPYRRETIY